MGLTLSLGFLGLLGFFGCFEGPGIQRLSLGFQAHARERGDALNFVTVVLGPFCKGNASCNNQTHDQNSQSQYFPRVISELVQTQPFDGSRPDTRTTWSAPLSAELKPGGCRSFMDACRIAHAKLEETEG